MANTEFSVFAQKLAVILRGDTKPEDFAKELFQAIYLPTTEDDPVDKTLPRTYRSYYYGQRNITDLARGIADSLDPVSFVSAYTIETDASIAYLCKSFREECPEITKDNYNFQIAERFCKIIVTAAATQKRKTPSTTKVVESVPVTPPPLKEMYGVYLVTEAGNCPYDGCTKSLYIRNNGRLEMVYDVSVIDPEQPEDNTDNLIALCPACCARYSSSRNPDSIQRMKSIKKMLMDTC